MTEAVGRLVGRVAVVTGGGAGIGRATATRFVAEGARVIVADRSEAVDEVAARLDAVAVRADVSVEAEVRRLFATCDERFGRLDILMNNAGVTGPVSNAADMDMAAWDETMGTNVRGVLLCIKYAVPLMIKSGGGSIINMSSLMGLKGYPMRSPYAASKFAVIGITESVAHEVGVHGIRVNALCPGAVSGDLMDRVIARRVAAEGRSREEIIKTAYTDVAALRKWVDPEEVAAVAAFLASDDASAVTGDRIKVDAGRM